MQQAIVDRVEGDLAVLIINDEQVPVPLTSLPVGTREGDYLQLEMNGSVIIRAEQDTSARETAEKRIAEKLDRLRRGDHLSHDDTL